MAVPQTHIDQFRVTENPGQPDTQPEESFEAKLIKEVRNYYDLTKLTRARRYYLWTLADLFAKGIHYIDYDPYKGTVEEWSADKVARCMYTPIPLLQYAVEVIAAQYTTSNGRSVPMPTDTSDPKTKAVVRGLQDYAEYLDWDFYRRDPAERQTEAKLIPLRGVYNFLEYDKTAGRKIQLPQYEPQNSQVCADCGAEVQGNVPDMQPGAGAISASPPSFQGTANGVPPVSMGLSSAQGNQEQGIGMAQPAGAVSQLTCPECGSSNIQQMTLGVQNQGMMQARQGAIKRNVVDAFQVEVYDRRRNIEQSKHLIYDEILFKTEAKAQYPWLKEVKGSATLGSYEQGFLGLHYLNQLQILLANTGRLDQSQPEYLNTLGPSAFAMTGYYGSYLHEILCWRRRCWFDLEVYQDWKIERPLQLPGTNQIIPAGSKPADIWPDGMCVHIVNGDLVVQIENQDKNTRWSYCSYRVPTAGMHGTGVSSLVALVRGNDEAHSIGMQALLMAALGIVIADERVPRVENIPGRVLTVPLDANPLGQPLSSFAARIDMGGGAVIAAAEPIKEGLRGAIGDMSMAANPQGSGLRPQSVGGETATAVRYNAGATGTLTGPPMELYAAHRAKVVEQAIGLERIYNLQPRLYGKAGETTAKWFEPMQVPEDLKFGVAEESWRPRTMETQREDIVGAVSIGVGQGAIVDPAIEEKARRVFGLDDETDGYDDWMILAEKRLDAMKAVLPQVMEEVARVEAELQGQPMPMVVDPETGQAQPAYDPVMRLIQLAEAMPRPLDMPGHVHYVRFYNEVYQTDEFSTFPPILQQAIEKLFLMHQQGIGQAGAVQTEIQLAAQQPAMDAQQGMQEQQAAQQGDQEEEAREHEDDSKEMDHAQATDADEQKHNRAMEMEKLKHSHNMELEKARGQNRPQQQHSQARTKRR